MSIIGKRMLDHDLPNDEAHLRALITNLEEHGRVLLVVDQPATIGALPVVARAEGVAVAYLPGVGCVILLICTQVDARDPHIIAEAARCMPRTLRSLKLADNEFAERTMLCGFDDDLAGQINEPAIASAAC